MKFFACSLWSAGCLTIGLATLACGQPVSDTVEGHRAAAKAAAGADFLGVYDRACPALAPAPPARQQAAARPPDPPREEWYAEPVRVFDNLYFVGTKVHGAWAVPTSDGIIVIDTLYSYAAEPEIAGGLRKLGLDPAKIRYVVSATATAITTEAPSCSRICSVCASS